MEIWMVEKGLPTQNRKLRSTLVLSKMQREWWFFHLLLTLITVLVHQLNILVYILVLLNHITACFVHYESQWLKGAGKLKAPSV